MTPADFVQWLRGFLDAIDGQPTSVQLEKIRERLTGVQAISVGAIDFTKLTRKDFVLPTTHYYDGSVGGVLESTWGTLAGGQS